ncbi:unnamed protein product [Meganyctiphanes norvegica]|uniref:Uncharacterized protein n=1 Tax=Meganyctiphanes norvegica TaxID=48144 RepID=A0AAV2QU82_MEGNR
MKYLSLLLLVGVACGQLLPEIEPELIRSWLETPEAAEKSVSCIIRFDAKTCDQKASTISAAFPLLARLNFECPASACSPSSAKNIKFVVGVLQAKYPDQWNRLTKSLGL